MYLVYTIKCQLAGRTLLLSSIFMRCGDTFLFSIIDNVVSKKNFLFEMFDGEKYDCPSINKKIYTVKSEIQCTHRCLQNDACELINYNTERDVKENCEIFTEAKECSTKVRRKKWTAMRFQVCSINVPEYLLLLSFKVRLQIS